MSSTNRGGERQDLDHYQTPRWCVDILMGARRSDGSHHMPRLDGKRVLEPSAGRGAIIRALAAHGAISDLTWGIERDNGRSIILARLGLCNTICDDFGDRRSDYERIRPDAIVMNPPYSLAEEHVSRACSLLAPGGTCAALLRLAFIMEGECRRAFRKAHPCDVLVLDKRPSFTAEILTWATDAELQAMALTKKTGEMETVDDVRRRLRGSDSAAYAWALFGEGRGGRYQVLEVP